MVQEMDEIQSSVVPDAEEVVEEMAMPVHGLGDLCSNTLIVVGRTHWISNPFLISVAKRTREAGCRQVSLVGGVLDGSASSGLRACRKAEISLVPFQVLNRPGRNGFRLDRLLSRGTIPSVAPLLESRMVDFVLKAAEQRPVKIIAQVGESGDGNLNFGIGCDYIKDAVTQCAGRNGIQVFLELLPNMPTIQSQDQAVEMTLREMEQRGVNMMIGEGGLPDLTPSGVSIVDCPFLGRVMEILSYERGKALYLEQNSLCCGIAERIIQDSSWEGWGSADLLSHLHRNLFDAGKFQGFVAPGAQSSILEGKMVGTHAMGDEAFYRWLDGREDVHLARSKDMFRASRFHGTVVVSKISGLDFQLRILCEGRECAAVAGPGLLSIALRGVAEDQQGVFIGCLTDMEMDRWGRCVPALAPRIRWRAFTRAALAEITPYSLGRMYVVTPYGVTNLAGKTPAEAIRSLIEIASPDLRRPLRKVFSNFP